MACTTDDPQILEYRLDNGLWFNGETFEARTGYVENGLLRFSDRHHEAIKVIDLEGGFVAPPFCEGHNHNIGGAADGVESVVARYLKDGVFYAMMPGSFSYYREIIADKINTPSSVDVAFANNGLTGSGGHPSRLREMLMERYGNYPEFTKASLPDRGYFEANTLEELREKWNLILAEKPDFIKVMLLYAEEYEERKNDPAYYGSRGLDPALMPELVRLAQKEGLRVAVHVETDFDMATALRAGADIIAHLPSNSSPERISGETIALAKKTNAALVTTLSVAKRFQLRSPERYAATIDAQRENLRRLEHAGVKLVLGSDNVRDTSRGEAQHLASLGVLDNGTLLRMWTVNCARAVFPERKIGQLADGYEASFLVLENDPLLDFEHTRSIRLRMKDGEILELNDGFVER
ncbi:MAG: amidohydrolase family protein [Pseudomonadota bacterium]